MRARRRVHAVNGRALSLQWQRDGAWRQDDGRVWCGTMGLRTVTRPMDDLRDLEKLTCRRCRRILLRFCRHLGPDVEQVVLTTWAVRDGALARVS